MNQLRNKVLELIKLPTETEWVEFKENLNDPQTIGEYISALSNSAALASKRNGYLIWGVSDKNHEVVGTSFNPRKIIEKSNEELQHWLARQLSPSINFKFEETIINDKRVVVLMIDHAVKDPVHFGSEKYLRIGSSKVNLKKFPDRDFDLWQTLRYEKPNLLNLESREQDLSFSKLLGLYFAKEITLNQKTFKTNLNLLTPTGKYNQLAYLLSDEPQISIRVSRFFGDTKGSKMQLVKEFGNTCIIVSLLQIIDYGEVINIIQSSDDGRIPRVDTPYFDQTSYNEVIINAFVHNLWSDGLLSPSLTIYSNRLEIISHGGLPKNQSLEEFYIGVSKPVNEALANILVQLKISERTGRGIPRVVEVYGKDVFDFKDNSLIVTLPFNIITQSATTLHSNITQHTLNKTQEKILLEVSDNPSISKEQLAKKLELSVSTIKKNISYLRSLNLVEFVGPSKTGYWKVNN